MKIQLSCPACRVRYSVSSQFGGRMFKCKKCGAEITIPIIPEQFEPSTTLDATNKSQSNPKSYQDSRFEISKQYGLQEGKKRIVSHKAAKFISISVIILLVAALAAKFGYQAYQVFQLKNKLEEAIGRDAGYTETILKVESDASNMNYLELFTLCNKSIEDRTNLIVELRGLFPRIKYELKEDLIKFLNEENRLIRAKRDFYRQQLSFSSSANVLKEYISDSDYPTSISGLEYSLKRVNSMRAELLKVVSAILVSADDYKASYTKLLKFESTLSKKMSKENIIFNQVFKQYEEETINFIDKSKENAEEIKRSLL